MDSLKNVKNIKFSDYADDFLRTLSNFCSKNPLQPRINYVKELGKIYLEYGEGKSLSYELNPLKNKKDVIKEIKTKLQQDYPVFYTKKVTTLPANEIEKLVKDGMPLAEALNIAVKEFYPKYKVIRVHHAYNELDCMDMQTRIMYKFHSELPVTAILEELRHKPKDNEDVMKNITLLYRMDKADN